MFQIIEVPHFSKPLQLFMQIDRHIFCDRKIPKTYLRRFAELNIDLGDKI